jgi:hypothetical protein
MNELSFGSGWNNINHKIPKLKSIFVFLPRHPKFHGQDMT